MESHKQNTALLIMDMQAGVLGTFPHATGLIGKVAEAMAHARLRNVPVIYIAVGFRPGGPEISSNNKIFAATKERMAGSDMTESMKIHSDLAPLPGDIVISKRRVSAFTGSDLEVILRAQNIQHIVLTGFATGGVVLSTLREASDKDYRISVLSDCCADYDEEVHRVLTTKVFPRQAEVITREEWFKD